ncbi:MAG: helix-turn-helix transcriptional regulator [Deltaproteobacteria bacterium]|nr:MAG: helix-turn-helix transcriptional regulator [Deltaproteobacteria bacterium]
MTSDNQATPLEDERCEVRTIHLDRIKRARTEAIGEQELQCMAQIYKVLGDPTRLKILLALRGDEMCVCDLAAFLCLTESAVSHQLRRLKDLGLVKNRRDGQILYYSLNDDHVAELIRVGLDHLRE